MLETKNFFVTIRISLKNCRMVRDSENNLLASIMNGQGGEGEGEDGRGGEGGIMLGRV